ncbi:MAG: hypothetical protein ACT4P1_11350 [Sporichthyaceae bacterium]
MKIRQKRCGGGVAASIGLLTAGSVVLGVFAGAMPAAADSTGKVRVCVHGLGSLKPGESLRIDIDDRFFARFRNDGCKSGSLRIGKHTLDYRGDFNGVTAINLDRERIIDKNGTRSSEYGFRTWRVFAGKQTKLDEYYDVYDD